MTEAKQYDDTNRGVAFANARKTKPTHADYTGKLNVDGQELWLDIWVKDNPRGGKLLSVSVKKKEPRGEAKPEIPF